MIRLLRFFRKKEWLCVIGSVAFILAQVQLDLKMPEYMNLITRIAQGAINEQTGAAYGMSDIWSNGTHMLLCALLSCMCAVATSWFVVHIAANYSARLREMLYTKIQGFSMAEISRFSTASLITP